MNALQLQVDPFDIDFDQTRRQDLELEKPSKKKKAPAGDDDAITPPVLDTDLDEDLDGIDKLEDEETEEEIYE